jgi:hypothetical protein
MEEFNESIADLFLQFKLFIRYTAVLLIVGLEQIDSCTVFTRVQIALD